MQKKKKSENLFAVKAKSVLSESTGCVSQVSSALIHEFQ